MIPILRNRSTCHSFTLLTSSNLQR